MSDSPNPMPDRRRFLQLVGLAAMSATVAGATPGLAQTSRRPGAKPKAPSSAPATEISNDTRDLVKIVKRRYGHQLDREQLDSITREIEYRLGAGQQLRDVKLENHDEPDFTFHA